MARSVYLFMLHAINTHCSSLVLLVSHPTVTVEVAFFGSNVPERLSFSDEELPAANDNSASILVLAH